MKTADIGIHIIIAIFIWFVSWTATVDIRHEDLEGTYVKDHETTAVLDDDGNHDGDEGGNEITSPKDTDALNDSNYIASTISPHSDDYETTAVLDDGGDHDRDKKNNEITSPKVIEANVTKKDENIEEQKLIFVRGHWHHNRYYIVRRTETELTCLDAYDGKGGIMLKHCYDDPHCKLYRDCCRNSKTYYEEREQTVTVVGIENNSLFGCYQKDGMEIPVLMIDKCPTTMAAMDREIGDKCVTGGGDFVSGFPVTSAVTGHTYKNVYCAWCHGERHHVVYWKPKIKCTINPVVAQLEDLSDYTILYRNGMWYYVDYENWSLQLCTLYILPPRVEPKLTLRPCNHVNRMLIDGCPIGTPESLARACASHTYFLYGTSFESPQIFRNVDCALCNNVTTNRLLCVPPIRMRTQNVHFESLFTVRRTDPCTSDELYDVFANTCRNVLRDELSLTCRTYVAFDVSEYDGQSLRDDDGTVTAYVYVYKKRVRCRARPLDNGTLDVCTEDAKGLLRPYSMPGYAMCLEYAGVVGSSVSFAALAAHLALFFTGAEPKNLPEKNLASLAVSLLLGYGCYVAIAVSAVPVGNGLPCLASALVMHFGFLAAFAWMFVISADVCMMLYKKFRVAKGKRNGRFAVYSTFAWFAPAAVTALAAALQMSAVRVLPELRPNFQHTCWFRNPQSLIALFVLPAGTTIAVNCVSFVGAVQLIATSGDGLKRPAGADDNSSSGVSHCRNNLKIYMRLSLITGLSWAFGLTGAVIDSDVVWTLYTALNSLQGAFIFLAFDCDWYAVRTLPVVRQPPSVSNTQTITKTTTSGEAIPLSVTSI